MMACDYGKIDIIDEPAYAIGSAFRFEDAYIVVTDFDRREYRFNYETGDSL